MDPALGDPATLRFVASTLRQEAQLICELSSDVVSGTSSFTYTGPAASEFFDVINRAHYGICSGSEQLIGLAAQLEAAAMTAEAAQAGGVM